MIDIHCHILPEVDDGAGSMEEALDMCRMAEADGISTVVATPHYGPGIFGWNAAGLRERVAALRGALRVAGSSLTILGGAELPLLPELPELLRGDPSLAINSSSYFLVEFRPHALPAQAVPFLESLMAEGLVPVIAHPERCTWFSRQPEQLAGLVAGGAMLQVSAGSLLGVFGPQVREFSQVLVRNGMARVIASDGHDRAGRPPLLSRAVALAAELVGEERARSMVTSTPAAIISGQRLQFPAMEQPLPDRASAPRSWFRRLLGAAA